MIGVIDFDSGNTGSIHNLLRKLGHDSISVVDTTSLSKCNAIILPGVGHFDHAVSALKKNDLWEPIIKFVISDGKPYLGICLGMQLIGLGSEEGVLNGFGWLNAATVKLNADRSLGLKSPNMGWRVPNIVRLDSLIEYLYDMPPKYYFAHSFALTSDDKEFIVATSKFGTQEFICAIQKGNIFGVQFHPEKSHIYGENLIRNFVSYVESIEI
jgi:glutamine amidotransferase